MLSRYAIIRNAPRVRRGPVAGAAVLHSSPIRRRVLALEGVWRGTMSYDVTLIPGDGTGPEITEATRRVLDATGVPFTWHVQEAGWPCWRRPAPRCPTM